MVVYGHTFASCMAGGREEWTLLNDDDDDDGDRLRPAQAMALRASLPQWCAVTAAGPAPCRGADAVAVSHASCTASPVYWREYATQAARGRHCRRCGHLRPWLRIRSKVRKLHGPVGQV